MVSIFFLFFLIALTCNLIVVTGGAVHFIRNKHVNTKLLFPFIFASIPFAFRGRINKTWR